MKKHLILGAAGFLGGHLEYRLRNEGHYVVSVARHHPIYRKSIANEFNILDLCNIPDFHAHFWRHDFDCVWQLAGSVGGLGFIGIGDNDADILTESVKINLHTLEAIKRTGGVGKLFFASSQCVYPDVIEVDPFANERIAAPEHYAALPCRESDASFNTFAFGQEKLFAEKLYEAYARNHGFKIAIGRIGNTYGPYCEWREPRAKVVAALCRKVATLPYAAPVELWGDGTQSRSFTYVDDTIDGMIRLMADHYYKPVNIAHAEPVTIQELLETVGSVAGKILAWKSTQGPVGVRARTSDNRLCLERLDWEPTTSLRDGLKQTYPWIAKQALTVTSIL